MTMKLTKDERRLAAVTADVIATAEGMGLPDAASGLASKRAIQLLARAFIEQRDQIRTLQDLVVAEGVHNLEWRDQIRALHDLVDQTDPNDPVGTALTMVGLARRP